MHVESVAIIPRCAECEAHWLPADKERWQAWLTDDEPPSSCSTAATARNGNSASTDARAARRVRGGIGLRLAVVPT